MDCEDYVTPGSPIDEYLKSIAEEDLENELKSKVPERTSKNRKNKTWDILCEHIFSAASEIRSYVHKIEEENRRWLRKLELSAKNSVKKAVCELLSDEDIFNFENELDVLAVECQSPAEIDSGSMLKTLLPITIAQAVYIALYWEDISCIYSVLHLFLFVISFYVVLW